MQIIAISGSLRHGSFNTALLRALRELAPQGMDITIERLNAIPLYDADLQAQAMPEGVLQLAQLIRNADGLLIATPEYNFSVPGVLKNAIDWISRVDEQPFNGKPIGIMGAAGSLLGTARAQYHLRQVFVYLNGHIMNRPEAFIGGARNKFDAGGKLADEATRQFLVRYLTAFESWVRQIGPAA